MLYIEKHITYSQNMKVYSNAVCSDVFQIAIRFCLIVLFV